MKNIFLVIQGHTQYCDDVIESVKELENVIWSTDIDSPKEDLIKIRNSNIILTQNERLNSGFGNINWQIQSTMSGLYLAKTFGATHAIKMRSDMIFSDAQKFIDNMDLASNKLHHLTYVNHINSNLSLPRERFDIDQWILSQNYQIKNLSSYNYITDFINYGALNEMIDFWNYPFEEGAVPVPAEHKLVFRYLTLKNKEIDMSFENISDQFGLFLSDLQNLNIKLLTLKWGYDYALLGTGDSKNAYLG